MKRISFLLAAALLGTIAPAFAQTSHATDSGQQATNEGAPSSVKTEQQANPAQRQGLPPRVSMGRFSTLPPGSTPTVSITGSNGDYRLNVGIPSSGTATAGGADGEQQYNNNGQLIGLPGKVNAILPMFAAGQPIKGVQVSNGGCTSNPMVTFPAPQYRQDGSQATAQGLCIQGQTLVYISFPGGGYTASQTPTITGGGTHGATGTLELAGTAGPADPTGKTDSSAAILNAIDHAQAMGVMSKNAAQVRIPNGTYRLDDTLRVPCDVTLVGDAENATILEPANNSANGLTFYSVRDNQPNAWTCTGGARDLSIVTPNGHFYKATELAVLGSTGLNFNNIVIGGGGGIGINLEGGSERNSFHNISINTVRWPLVVNGNENTFVKLNIASPGEAGDRWFMCTGYQYTSNCVDGKYPSPEFRKGALVSAAADGSTARFYVKGDYGNRMPQGVSPIIAGMRFVVAGTSGSNLNGTYTVTKLFQNVRSGPGGQCTSDSPCFEVEAQSTQNGTANVTNATWKPAILPDRNSAVWFAGADDTFIGGSIKALWAAGAFTDGGSFIGRVSDFYLEGFPVNGQPHVDSEFQAPGLQPQTKLKEALTASAGKYTVVGVDDPGWFPEYVQDKMDAYEGKGVYPARVRITCADYQYGSMEPCAGNSAVERGQWEDVNGYMTGDGFMILQRDLDTSTVKKSVAWPAGSLVTHVLVIGYYPQFNWFSNHDEAIDAPSDGWATDCDDHGKNICGSFLLGNIPDMVVSFTPKNHPSKGIWGVRSYLSLIDNEERLADTEADGANWIKVVGNGGFATALGWHVYPDANDGSVVNNELPGERYVDVENADGSYGWSDFSDLDDGLTFAYSPNGHPAYSKTINDGTGHVIPGVNANPDGTIPFGMQYADSYCFYDTPATVGGHAAEQTCMLGGPHNSGSNAGFIQRHWDGSKWVVDMKVDGNGNAMFQGTLEAGHLRVNGAPGYTGTKRIGSCTLSITQGLITGVSGC